MTTELVRVKTKAFVETLANRPSGGATYSPSAPASPTLGQLWVDSDEDLGLAGADIYSVKTYGALGTGSGGASADQSGFAAAIAAANASAYGGVVYVPPGDYYVTGPFTFDPNVSLVGAAWGAVAISHTGNNAFITSTADNHPERRYFADFRLYGNGGAAARGLVIGNTTHPALERVRVRDYNGTDGIAILFTNSISWTEQISVRDIELRENKRGMVFKREGGQASFCGFHAHNLHIQSSVSGSICFDMAGTAGNNVSLYASSLDLKCQVESNAVTAIHVGPDSGFYYSNCNITVESGANTTAVTLDVDANAWFRADGQIYVQGSQNPYTAGQGVWNIDSTAVVELGQPETTMGPFRAHRNSSGQVISDNTATLVDMTTKAFDPAGWFNTSTDRYTPQRSGYYWISAGAYLQSFPADTRAEAMLYKNGTFYSDLFYISGVTTGGIGNTGGALVYMNGTTDYLQLYIQQITGSSKTLDGDPAATFLSGYLVGT